MNKYALIGKVLEDFESLAKTFTSLEKYLTEIEIENLRNVTDALDDAMAQIIMRDFEGRYDGN